MGEQQRGGIGILDPAPFVKRSNISTWKMSVFLSLLCVCVCVLMGFRRSVCRGHINRRETKGKEEK